MMKTKTALLVAGAVCAAIQTATVAAVIPTTAQETTAERAVETAITDDNNWIPKLVRLSFHDCVGGCDGCLSFENSENNGLRPVVTMLDGIYDATAFGMSRADFWAVAGAKAVVMSATNAATNTAANIPSITVLFGRTDCAGGTSEYASSADPNIGKFPDGHGDLANVLSVFETGMGLTKSQVVAVVGGGHSLGQASPENSGFAGPWSPPLNDFDNGFFKNLVDLEYTQVVQNAPGNVTKYQWEGPADNTGPQGGPPPAQLFMLNADVALYREVTLSSAGIDSACPTQLSDCVVSNTTADYVEDFAANPQLFAIEFGTGFKKMIENGAADGQLSPATGNSPTAKPTVLSLAAPQQHVGMDTVAVAVGVAAMAMWT